MKNLLVKLFHPSIPEDRVWIQWRNEIIGWTLFLLFLLLTCLVSCVSADLRGRIQEKTCITGLSRDAYLIFVNNQRFEIDQAVYYVVHEGDSVAYINGNWIKYEQNKK